MVHTRLDASEGTMSFPNFLVIGANKAGTTSLYHYLKQHPQVYMSPEKEPMYFALTGAENQARQPDHAFLKRAVYTLEDYLALFQGVTDQRAIGEASTAYLATADAPARIRQHMPSGKLIAILRDPAERAHSAHSMYVSMGMESLTDFGTAVDRELGGCEWRRYVKLGFYYTQLKRYFELFEAAQLQVFLYEEFKRSPQAVMKSIFGFLGVDDSFVPEVSARYHVTVMPRNRTLHKFLLSGAVRTLLPGVLRRRLVQWTSRRPESLAGSVRQRLVSVYRDDILKLEDLIRRDLSAWRR